MSLGDLLYEFTDWLRTTPLIEFSLWLSETSVSQVIQTNFWVIPSLQTIHILFIGLAFGAVLMLNLRVLGVVGGHRNLVDTSRRYSPWIRWSFLGLVVTGLLMVVGEPVRELINSVFWVKMALIVIGIFVALAFQRAVEKSAGVSGGLKGAAVLVILLWCAIMAGGRWIAYAPV